MRPIFGPQTERVLEFLADLWLLSPEEISKVTTAWKEASDLERAEAWAQLHRVVSGEELEKILAAASVARRQAMDAAYLLQRADWEFWAAAWDAAAALAAEERIGTSYYVLTRPLTTVMPSLSEIPGGARVPTQRARKRAAERRGDVDQSPTRTSATGPGTHPTGPETHPTGKRLAGGRR